MSWAIPTDLLRKLRLDEAAHMSTLRDPVLLAANQARINQTGALMRASKAQGVPSVVAESAAGPRLLDRNVAFSNPSLLLSELQAA